MKNLFIAFLILPYSFFSQQLDWVNTITTSSQSIIGNDGSVLFDNFKNVLVVGTFRALTDFSTDTVPVELQPESTESYYITKYDSIGSLIWVGSVDSCRAKLLFVDKMNNFYLKIENIFNRPPDSIVSYPHLIDVDFSNSVYNVSMDEAIVCYDENGNFIWARENMNFPDFYLSSDSNIVCVSHPVNQDTLVYQTQTGIDSMVLTGPSQPVAVLLEFNTFGDFIQTFEFKPFQNGIGADISIKEIIKDSLNNIYVTGTFKAQINFGLNANNQYITANENGSVFLAKYDSNLNFKWLRQFDNELIVSEIKVAGLGNVLLAGYILSDLMLPDSSWILTNINKQVVLRIDSSGNYVNSISFTGSFMFKIAANNKGVMYAYFSNNKPFDLNPNGSPYILGDVVSQPVFIGKYNQNFEMEFAFRLGELSVHVFQGDIDVRGESFVINGIFSSGASINFDPVDSTSLINIPLGTISDFIVLYQGDSAILNSIDESKEETDFVLVYPNPTSQILKINYAKNKRLKYNVYDIQGHLEFSGSCTSGGYINLSPLARGSYLIQFFDKEEGLINTVKFIKN